MKKIFLAIGLLLTTALFYLGLQLYKQNQKVVLTSSHDSYSLTKSEDYKKFEDFLNQIGFWEENNVSSTKGERRVTAKKLIIEVTDTPQTASFYKKSLTDQEFYSSISYQENAGVVKLTIHIDTNICLLPDCGPNSILNKQIINTLYQATNLLENKGKIEGIDEHYLDYFKLNKKLVLVKSAFAQSCSWQCRPQTCDIQNNCICGPGRGFTEVGSCGTGCPPGYCASGGCTGCSGSGGTGPAACTNRTVNCPANTTINLNQPVNVGCRIDNGYQMCAPGLGSAQRDTGCCRYIRVNTDDCWTKPSGKVECTKETICVNGEVTTYACTPNCTTTAPALSSFNYSSVNNTLNWTPGTGGVSQQLYVSTSISAVQANCQTGTCTVSNTNLGATTSSYPLPGLTAGATYYAKIVNYTSSSCSASSGIYSFVAPNPALAWWQVIDADVSGADVRSSVPSGLYFDTVGAGGYPGVPVYTASTNLTTANVSTGAFGWLANSPIFATRVFDYQFFSSQIPESITIEDLPSSSVAGSYFETGGTLSGGYYWYKYDGSSGVDLNITSAFDLGDRRVVLLVENSDLTVSGNINLDNVPGSLGFFGVFVEGNINVNPAVTSLEGVYLSNGVFTTGVGATQLNVRGSVAAGSFSLQRELTPAQNQTTPSELFEYGPDQLLVFPSVLSYRKINWKEVAP